MQGRIHSQNFREVVSLRSWFGLSSLAPLLLLVFALLLLAGCSGQPQATPGKDRTARAVEG